MSIGEFVMQLDNLIVICLALLFFGGILYLALRERKQEDIQNSGSAVPSQPEPEPPPAPQRANGANQGRKKRKRRNK
jgi:hypothetical protein